MARAYLKGLPELKAKLIRLQRETAVAVRPAMEAAAIEITDMMKRMVPTDSGALRDSIGWSWGEAPKGSVSVSHGTGPNKITIFAGNSEAFYARWVEFGIATHEQGGLFEGTQHPGNAAQPFFFPAYRALRKKVKRMIGKAVRDAVKKVAAT